jgi:hypothetical protein
LGVNADTGAIDFVADGERAGVLMNTRKVKEWLKCIKDAVRDSDDEVAHSREDDMAWEIIEAIAKDDCEDPQACCDLALKSQKLDFARWCA